jgi:hypothetical protein
MFRFTIRDLLWLMLVVGCLLGWRVWWYSQQQLSSPITGSISIGHQPLMAGRIFFYSKGGKFYGAHVADGEFQTERLPIGEYQIIIEGEDVADLYSDLAKAAFVPIGRKTKSLQFGLHSKEYLAKATAP